MKFNKGIAIVMVAVVAVIIMVIVGVNSVHANAIKYEEKVTEAWSNIKVAEKRRADLLPTLADAIKAYDKHEYNTLMDVINARKAQGSVITDDDVKQINTMIDFLVEDYPQLSSNENYKEFMTESAITENNITDVRKAYNTTVSRYNDYTRPPLTDFFLSITGYEKIEFKKLSFDVSEDAPTNLFD